MSSCCAVLIKLSCHRSSSFGSWYSMYEEGPGVGSMSNCCAAPNGSINDNGDARLPCSWRRMPPVLIISANCSENSEFWRSIVDWSWHCGWSVAYPDISGGFPDSLIPRVFVWGGKGLDLVDHFRGFLYPGQGMPSLSQREQEGLASSHLILLDLHSAHPLRDLVMFFRIDNDIRSLKAPLGLHDDAV